MLPANYRQYEDRFNMTGIEMPMQLKDIPRFERQNNISVSVYGWEPAKENEEGEAGSWICLCATCCRTSQTSTRKPSDDWRDLLQQARVRNCRVEVFYVHAPCLANTPLESSPADVALDVICVHYDKPT